MRNGDKESQGIGRVAGRGGERLLESLAHEWQRPAGDHAPRVAKPPNHHLPHGGQLQRPEVSDQLTAVRHLERANGVKDVPQRAGLSAGFAVVRDRMAAETGQQLDNREVYAGRR